MTPTRARVTRAAAGAAIASLVATGLITTPAAHAADRVIPSNLVDLRETRATGHNDFGADGVRVWTEGNTSTDKAAGYFDVNKPLADVGEPSMDWAKNNNNGGFNVRPSVQLKVDFDGNGSIDGILVGEPVYADGTPLYGDNWWASGGSAQFVKDGAPSHSEGFGSTNNGTLDQWRTSFPDAKVIEGGWSLGSGVKGDGFIYGITIDDTYYFEKAPAPETKVLYRSDVDLQYTRTKGHNDFRPTSGVRVYTDAPADSQSKAAGYFDVNKPLDQVGLPVFKHRVTSGQVPGNQLVVDLDGDGVEDGTLVEEAIVPGIWWMSSSTLSHGPVKQAIKDRAPRAPGSPGVPGYSVGGGTPAEWRAEFPGATLLKGGWSLGSGAVGDGVIESITYGDTTYTFTGKNRAPVASNVTADATLGQPVTVTLDATDPDGDALTYSSDDGTVDGDELTITPTAAGEQTYDYRVTDARGASDTATVTLDVNTAPVLGDVATTSTSGVNKVITLAGTDADGDAITYSESSADASISGTQLTVTVPRSFVGTKSVVVTATDARGATDTGTVTVNVTAATSTLTVKATPSSIKSGQTSVISATVTSTGTFTGGRIDLYSNGKRIALLTVPSSGTVSYRTPKLGKGVRTLQAKFVGTTSAKAVNSGTTTLTVK